MLYATSLRFIKLTQGCTFSDYIINRSYHLKARRLLYVQTGLTFTGSTFGSKSEFVCFVHN
jgi:hypothetical protein